MIAELILCIPPTVCLGQGMWARRKVQSATANLMQQETRQTLRDMENPIMEQFIIHTVSENLPPVLGRHIGLSALLNLVGWLWTLVLCLVVAFTSGVYAAVQVGFMIWLSGFAISCLPGLVTWLVKAVL
jgi:hypothetical protein